MADYLGDKFGSWKCDAGASDKQRKVRFGGMRRSDKVVHTTAITLRRKWTIVYYGGAIACTREGPVDDVFGEVITGRNQCLAIHLDACDLHIRTDQMYPQVPHM